MNTSGEYVEQGTLLVPITRSHRKTVSIQIRAGKVLVRAPYAATFESIQAFVHSKLLWIEKKLVQYRALVPERVREYVSGEEFMYLGRPYFLVLVLGRSGVERLEDSLVVSTPDVYRQAHVKSTLECWYRAQADLALRERTRFYIESVGAEPTSVSVRAFRARWGSCSNRGEIKYNWKLIMAPERIIDYVVVHELCHLHHHDHSKAFWSRVEQVLPDYQNLQRWLNINGQGLEV